MSAPPAAVADSLRSRYTLECELGRGGMATIYLARDLKHARSVALKVLHPELTATLGPARFLQEIQVTARLQHPHILPLIDSGEANGLVYYLMPAKRGRGWLALAASAGDPIRVLRAESRLPQAASTAAR